MMADYQWQGHELPTTWDFWQQTFPQLDPQQWESGLNPWLPYNTWATDSPFGDTPYGLVRASQRGLGFADPFGGGRGAAFEKQVGPEALQAQIDRMAPQLAGALGGYDPRYGANISEAAANQAISEATGYTGGWGGGEHLDWLLDQPQEIQDIGFQATQENVPERLPYLAEDVVARQPGGAPSPPPGTPETPIESISPQWDMWAGAFGADPAMWEGYGVDTGTTVNPWDIAPQFGVEQGILRAALENLGFGQNYGFGRAGAFIGDVGEEAVQGAIGQLTGEQPPIPPVVPGGQITAYQPNYSMFFNPQQMAGAVMGGIQPSYETPLWYRAQDVEYSPNPGQPQAASVVPPPAQPQLALPQSPPPVGIWDPRLNQSFY